MDRGYARGTLLMKTLPSRLSPFRSIPKVKVGKLFFTKSLMGKNKVKFAGRRPTRPVFFRIAQRVPRKIRIERGGFSGR